MTRSEVLIVGAGPTGLVLALWLTKLGVKVRIVDKTAEPGTTSRALAVHARTLELYRQLDLANFVIVHGHKVPAVRLWVKGKPKARVSFEEIGAGDPTPYPFLQIFPQDQHERLLVARLQELGARSSGKLSFSVIAIWGRSSSRICAHLVVKKRVVKQPISPVVTVCTQSCVRRWVQGIREALIVICFMSQMSRRPVLRSTANSMLISTRLTSSPCSRLPERDVPCANRDGAGRTCRSR